MKYFVLLIIIVSIVGCNSVKYTDLDTPRGCFYAGKSELKKKNYVEAQSYFDKIKLQFPASDYSDSAQYYLGEVSFAKKEFVMAAFHYSLIERHYPSSGLKKEARYKQALSNYELSPNYERDQNYTVNAIEMFQLFMQIYPGDSLFYEADTKVKELIEKLELKELAIANLYAKIDEPRAAIIYYNSLMDTYPNSKYYPQAYLGKIKMNLLMEKVEEAKTSLEAFKKKYLNPEYKSEIDLIELKIKEINNKK